MTTPQNLPIVPSYTCDEWWSPAAEVRATEVLDASTGEVVARVSTDGLDIATAVEHARSVGQKSLGELTIHERALLLKEIATYLNGRKQELYDLSFATGATQRDHLSDIDGGIGTMFTFSSKGRRELPNANVVVDGAPEVLSRDGSFIGRHVHTRLDGVMVQINAFNFPMWGMLEKFAPAFIAGVPTIVKPATPTGYVTEACVRMMVESGKLPAGALQLVSGSARDLLDHLDMRDMVAFTGSAATAGKLKLHPAVTERGCRFTAETDSLNAAVLGEDVTVDSPEFDAFIKGIMVEMTVKAGQKCTAIRRVVVPQAMVEPVVEALGAKIGSKIVVGDPRTEGSTMGPLASLDQREEVAKAVNALVEAGGRIAFGHGSPVPHLVHGGPGRAGGGEDLGGVRAVKHCMQRLAVQGGPDHLTAITGIGTPVPPRTASAVRTSILARASTPSARAWPSWASGTSSAPSCAPSPCRRSPTSPTRPATPSTRTPMRRRRWPTPSSRVASPTATCW